MGPACRSRTACSLFTTVVAKGTLKEVPGCIHPCLKRGPAEARHLRGTVAQGQLYLNIGVNHMKFSAMPKTWCRLRRIESKIVWGPDLRDSKRGFFGGGDKTNEKTCFLRNPSLASLEPENLGLGFYGVLKKKSQMGSHFGKIVWAPDFVNQFSGVHDPGSRFGISGSRFWHVCCPTPGGTRKKRPFFIRFLAFSNLEPEFQNRVNLHFTNAVSKDPKKMLLLLSHPV